MRKGDLQMKELEPFIGEWTIETDIPGPGPSGVQGSTRMVH